MQKPANEKSLKAIRETEHTCYWGDKIYNVSIAYFIKQLQSF